MPNATILGYNFIDSAIRVLDNYLLNISNYKGCSTTDEREIRELANERMRCEPELEGWGYASEIKQILNKIKAAPCEMREKRRAVVARRAGEKWEN